MAKKLLFVFNPHSGKNLIKYYLYDIIDIFVKSGYEVTTHPTQRRLDAYEQIKKRARNYDLVVISGGDGSLNEAVKGLMQLPESFRPNLGYIPAGTTNDFASSIGISKNVIEAAGSAVSGMPFTCDIGSFNRSNFIYVAAFGSFTDVSYDTPQHIKNVFGQMAYLVEGIKRLPTILERHHVKVEYDGNTIEDDFVFGMVSNTTQLAGQKRNPNLQVSLNDGIFEAALVRSPATVVDVQNILFEIANHNLNTDNIISFKASEIRFTFDRETAWTLDGEAGGCHKFVDIFVNPKAVTFKISAKSDDDYFSVLTSNYNLMQRKQSDRHFRLQKKFKELYPKE